MKKKSALTAMVAVLVILAMALPLRLTAARAEESYVLHGFTIAERDGKFGIIDANGRIVLPFDYYIPLDQFAPGEAPWCVYVYQYMEEEYTGVYDLTRDLETGRMKAGYFHLGSGYFSGCVWSHDVIAMDDCAAVCDDDLDMLVNTARDFLSRGANFLIFSGGMSVDPDDLTPSAIRRLGCEVVTHGVPSQPGNMTLMAYLGDIPVMGVPGAAISLPTTIFDVMLPQVFAGVKFTHEELINLGDGGLCQLCAACHFPNCTFGRY